MDNPSLRTMFTDSENQELVKEFTSEKKIPVVEIFGPTIQGEGPLAGTKTMFVRFGGCDFRCTKCDSLHAVIPAAVKKHAERLTQEEIFDRLVEVCQNTGTEWVTLSGGNPCMWDLSDLILSLRTKGINCAVETQGTLAPAWLRYCAMVVTSPKTPGMGEKFNQEVFARFVRACQNVPLAVKVVIFSALDLEFALAMGKIASLQHDTPVMKYLSLGNAYPPTLNEEFELVMVEPEGGLIPTLLQDYRDLLEKEFLGDPRFPEWRFMPQLHVLVWGNEAGR